MMSFFSNSKHSNIGLFFKTLECPPQTYGIACSMACGKCGNGSTCDPVTGQCTSGCEHGWTGEKCDRRTQFLSNLERVYWKNSGNLLNDKRKQDKALKVASRSTRGAKSAIIKSQYNTACPAIFFIVKDLFSACCMFFCE